MPEFNELKKALPTSFTSFAELRRRGAVYVDKTAFVQEIAYDAKPLILIRPRRFGKSTLLSTVEELFLHGLEPYDGHDSYFKGLSIERTWQDQGHYPVLHLDFYKLNSLCDTVADFERKLMRKIADFCREQQVAVSDDPLDFGEQFDYMLNQLPDVSLVLLVDEYDAPLLYHAHDEQELKAGKEMLRCLFGMVKSNSRKFRCVFFTGITRYQDLGLGTAGNNFTDISMDSSFAACCGYTREELKVCFRDHLRYSAAVRLGIRDEEVTAEQIEALLDEMAVWYDGYSFDGKPGSHVFSTWSVLRFFGDAEALLQPYWSDEEGVGLPQLLRMNLDRIKLPELINELSGGSLRISRTQFLQSSLVNPVANPYALLQQTGYLTLTAPYAGSRSVYLDCPNRELRIAFVSLVARCLLNNEDAGGEEDGQETVEILAGLDPEKIRSCFNRLFATLPYEKYPVQNEAMVRALIHFYLYGAGLKPLAEVMSSTGRADSIVDIPEKKLTVVFEYKYESSREPAKLDARLKEALKQIKERDYGASALSEPRVARLALVFCGDKAERGFARVALADVIHS